MENEIKTWLYDILNAIVEIEDFFSNGPMDFQSNQSDIWTKRAVERNLEIIGEAMKRILIRDTKISISNSRKIVDARNIIIHGYDKVSDEVIWGIIVRHIPTLKQEVENLIRG